MRSGFANAFWLMAAQRATKVLGAFVRLAVDAGKPGYLDSPSTRRGEPPSAAFASRLCRPYAHAMRAPAWSGPGPSGSTRSRPLHQRCSRSPPMTPNSAPKSAIVLAAGFGTRMQSPHRCDPEGPRGGAGAHASRPRDRAAGLGGGDDDRGERSLPRRSRRGASRSGEPADAGGHGQRRAHSSCPTSGTRSSRPAAA